VRSESTPDVATVRESGVADYDVVSWNALFAPAGTPAEIVNKLNGALRELLADAEVKKRLIELGIEAKASTPQEIQPGSHPTSQVAERDREGRNSKAVAALPSRGIRSQIWRLFAMTEMPTNLEALACGLVGYGEVGRILAKTCASRTLGSPPTTSSSATPGGPLRDHASAQGVALAALMPISQQKPTSSFPPSRRASRRGAQACAPP